MSLLLNHIFRERSLSFRTWSVYLTHIFLSTPSVGAACVCGVYVILILEHDKSLNKGQQDLTKLNTITSNLCRRLKTLQDVKFGFGRNCSPIEEYVILWFYIFIKTNSPSASNRNGRISKSEIYHTLQQLSQHDVLLEYFPTSISVCI